MPWPTSRVDRTFPWAQGLLAPDQIGPLRGTAGQAGQHDHSGKEHALYPSVTTGSTASW